LAPTSIVFFTTQQAFGLCLSVSLKHPLLLAFSKYIVVSEVHKMTFCAHVKVIGGELNLSFGDLPVLKCFDGQKSSLIQALKLPDASHFGVSLKRCGWSGVIGKY